MRFWRDGDRFSSTAIGFSNRNNKNESILLTECVFWGIEKNVALVFQNILCTFRYSAHNEICRREASEAPLAERLVYIRNLYADGDVRIPMKNDIREIFGKTDGDNTAELNELKNTRALLIFRGETCESDKAGWVTRFNEKKNGDIARGDICRSRYFARKWNRVKYEKRLASPSIGIFFFFHTTLNAYSDDFIVV